MHVLHCWDSSAGRHVRVHQLFVRELEACSQWRDSSLKHLFVFVTKNAFWVFCFLCLFIARYSTSGHDCFFLKPFPFWIHLQTYYLTLYRLLCWKRLKMNGKIKEGYKSCSCWSKICSHEGNGRLFGEYNYILVSDIECMCCKSRLKCGRGIHHVE